MIFVTNSPSDDEFAEGVPHNEEPHEPRHIRQPVMVPAVKFKGSDSPAGETGLLPAVFVPAESTDNNDVQDASRTTAELNASPTPSPAQPAEPMREKPLVLIVEDTALLAEIIQITLQRMQLESIVETRGDTALARYLEAKPDVILLDLGLPDMSGWTLLENIKEAVGETGTMPLVIVMTAFGDAANRLVGKFQNVHNYLVKPFTSDEIVRVVKQAINGSVG